MKKLLSTASLTVMLASQLSFASEGTTGMESAAEYTTPANVVVVAAEQPKANWFVRAVADIAGGLRHSFIRVKEDFDRMPLEGKVIAPLMIIAGYKVAQMIKEQINIDLELSRLNNVSYKLDVYGKKQLFETVERKLFGLPLWSKTESSGNNVSEPMLFAQGN